MACARDVVACARDVVACANDGTRLEEALVELVLSTLNTSLGHGLKPPAVAYPLLGMIQVNAVSEIAV